jgi:hypothetical protein
MQNEEAIMGEKRRRYRAIRQGLMKLYPFVPTGNLARRLNTLAYLISGIVGGKHVNLRFVAEQVPDGTKHESRIKKFSRWIANNRIEAEVYFLPFAAAWLISLGSQTLVLAIDGSEVGRECVTLMVSVIYKKRVLPIAWIVVKGKKGHFPEDSHVQLVEQVRDLVPDGCDVVFLGDGEFDGITLQATVDGYDWQYVSRTAKNAQLCEEEEWVSFADLWAQPGACFGVPDVRLTQQAYGPVLAVVWWKIGWKEPIYLVTNLETAEEARYWYRKRFRIETFFSDQKTRGFHLDKSHISEPERLSRLMIAACLAYIWIIYSGVVAKRDGWVPVIHRTERCDLSLFQLGLSLLQHFLDEGRVIPVSFQIPADEKSVR